MWRDVLLNILRCGGGNVVLSTSPKAWIWHQFDFGLTFSYFYLVTSNLLPNFLIAVSHSIFDIMSSVIPLNQIVGSELKKNVGFKKMF